MPHSKLKVRPIWLNLAGMIKCPCSQTLKYKSDRDEIMKLRMRDDKFCDKASGFIHLKGPRRAMQLKELQHRLAKFEREFHKWSVIPVQLRKALTPQRTISTT